jgi:hypothetical protein
VCTSRYLPSSKGLAWISGAQKLWSVQREEMAEAGMALSASEVQLLRLGDVCRLNAPVLVSPLSVVAHTYREEEVSYRHPGSGESATGTSGFWYVRARVGGSRRRARRWGAGGIFGETGARARGGVSPFDSWEKNARELGSQQQEGSSGETPEDSGARVIFLEPPRQTRDAWLFPLPPPHYFSVSSRRIEANRQG